MLNLTLIAIVLLAAWHDMRTRMIPNWLSLGGMAAGLAINAALGGLAGLRSSASGLLIGFGAYLCLYCLRAMGAGDVKLMGAVGAIVGPSAWFAIFLTTAIAGGLIATAIALSHGRLRSTLWNVSLIGSELMHLRVPHWRFAQLDVRHERALKMPHAVAIAAGTIAYAIWNLRIATP